MILYLILLSLFFCYLVNLRVDISREGDLTIMSPNYKWSYCSYSTEEVTYIDRLGVFRLRLGV